MKRCPRCNAMMTDVSTYCQFCNTSTASPPPQSGASALPQPPPIRPPRVSGVRSEFAWAWKAYYGVSAWWLISGLYQIVNALTGSNDDFPAATFISAAAGALTCVIALGLMLRIEIVRGIVNFVAGMRIILGAINLVFLFFLGGFFHPFGAFMVAYICFDIVMAGFLIFLIGETETKAPNW